LSSLDAQLLIRRPRSALRLAIAGIVLSFAIHTSAYASEPSLGNRAVKSSSIQEMVKRARSAGKIEIPPGIYRESLEITQSGTAQRPIIIEGVGGGSVVITG